MTVLLLTDSKLFAGTERHMHELGLGLRAAGVEVTFGCPSPSPLSALVSKDGFEVLGIPKEGLIDQGGIKKLAGYLAKGRADVVHAHNGRSALSATLANSRAGHGACVATQHFIHPTRTTRRGPRALLSRIAHHWVSRRIDHFIAISEAVCREMLVRGDAPFTKITVVPNGISPPDRSAFVPRDAILNSLGVSLHVPLVVCVARLEAEKGIETLIDAMREVVASVPDAHCLIAGSGSCEAVLHARIDALNLGEKIRLLGFRRDAMSLIHAADLFVLPSPAEPFGLVILEGMALSKCVVAARGGGPVEIIVDRQSGILFEPSNPTSLANAITALLQDGPQREKMGTAGLARYQERYTCDRMAESTLRVYERALASCSLNPLDSKTSIAHSDKPYLDRKQVN